MKTVSGKIVSTKPVNLSKAANILSNFATSDNGASQSVSAYLRRASAAFNELIYFKKHHKLEKDPSKEEASTKSDTSHRNVQEYEVRVQENGALNMKFDHDAVEKNENSTRKVEGKLRKKEKKKKDGRLGSGKNDDTEVDFEQVNENVKEKREEKKKKDGSLGSGKNVNTEVDFEQGNENGKENSEEKKKKKKKKRKNAEVDGGETSNSVAPKSKKRRKAEDE